MNIKWLLWIVALTVVWVTGQIVYTRRAEFRADRPTTAVFVDPIGDPDNLLPHASANPLIKADDDPEHDRIGRRPTSTE